MNSLACRRCSSGTAFAGPQQLQARRLPRQIKAFKSSGSHNHNHIADNPSRRQQQQQQQRQDSTADAAAVSRRHALLAGSATAVVAVQLLDPCALHPVQASAEAFQLADSSSSSSSVELQLYENTKQQYRMQVPVTWERKEKAGADVLFEDPDRRSTSVGVTVSPVRVANIGQFGDVEAVGQRLLEAERKKGSNGATLYDYEYELDSTRGKKRIFNTVTITGSKLYIFNGNFKCDKETGCNASDAAAPLGLLKQVADSFDAGSN